MSLLPRTTLHSDSEKFIYNWMLEDDLDLDLRKLEEAQRTRGKGDKSRDKVFTQAIIGKHLCPSSRVESRFSRKNTGGIKGKRA
jgi:hypothetical protein